MAYGILILTLFAAANNQGYAFTSLFSHQQHANKTDNRYHK
jgi:hypothetical protein